MTIRPIVIHGDPVLHNRCEEVTEPIEDLQELIAVLDEHAEGYTDGLLVIEAAVQRAPRAALHAALREQTTLTTGGRRD